MKVIINARDALGTRRGGIGRYSINLLENLAGITEDGTELSVVVSREDLESDARVGALSLAGKRLRLLPRSFGSDISRIYFDHAALLGEIDRGGADIVHALKFVLPSARSIPERVRKVVTIHDLIFLERPELFTARTRNYWKCVVKRSAARADAIVVPSEHTREQDRRHYGEEAADKCEVIHHGIDPVFLDRGREM